MRCNLNIGKSDWKQPVFHSRLADVLALLKLGKLVIIHYQLSFIRILTN